MHLLYDADITYFSYGSALLKVCFETLEVIMQSSCLYFFFSLIKKINNDFAKNSEFFFN